MRNIISIFLLVYATHCPGQAYDSSWIARTYMPGFTTDTGQYLSSIRLADENGNEKTLSDFRGKVLYIDLWTTWCVNCIANFPRSKRLYERLRSIRLDTAIRFINICSEDSKRAWKKMLKKHRPEGINLYARDTLFYESWKVNAFPRYLIVDPSGKILSFDGPDVRDGTIDFILYAAIKGIKPAEAIWIVFRQNQHFSKYQRFTGDAEGIDYDWWHRSTMQLRYQHSIEPSIGITGPDVKNF